MPTDEPSDADLFFVADRMIKVESWKSVASRTFKLGSDERQTVVFLTFTGTVNNTDDAEKDAVTVGIGAAGVPASRPALIQRDPFGGPMNTDTGQLYPTLAAARADLKPGQTEADLVEITGTREAAERLSRDVQQVRALERRRAANKVAKKSRQRNR